MVEWDSPRFEKLLAGMGKKRVEGARAVILLNIWKVGNSSFLYLSLLFSCFSRFSDRPNVIYR